MSFADLKRSRGNNLGELVDAINKTQKGAARQRDDRFWQPTLSSDKTASALIRFLPNAEGSQLNVPWARVKAYAFKGPAGGWYIENSPTTIGLKDPVAEFNTAQWNTNDPALQDLVRKRSQQVKFISNILVLRDPEKPENEGKIFLFKYGKKIFEKITEAANPDPKLGETGRNVFDFWEGSDFKLKVRYVSGFVNYDKSEFSAPAPLFAGDDAKLQELYGKLIKLDEFLDPKNFKSYDDLKTRMTKVLGLDGTTAVAPRNAVAKAAPVAAKTVESAVLDNDEEAGASVAVTEDDDTFSSEEKSYLQKLTSEDA